MKIRFIYLVATLFVFTTEFLTAQPSLPTAPTQAPIDGGLGLLAAAGGAYAIKKLRDRRKNEDENLDV